MKVLMLNGSPHEKGCTAKALEIVANELKLHGVDSEIIWLGTGPFESCRGCGFCRKNGKCIIDDKVNEVAQKVEAAEGFIFGTPTHYAAASGALTTFLDRLFYSAGKHLAFKPGAGVASCRRAGVISALDQVNKYFAINNMPMVGSCYWNIVYGAKPEEVENDLEGCQTMRTLAKNMAWLVKCIKSGKQNGIELPVLEDRVWTNFHR